MKDQQQNGSQPLENAPQTSSTSESKDVRGANQKIKGPYDHINAKQLSDQFFSQHNRTIAMQSFQILSQCFHPNFTSGIEKDLGEYILILEQQYQPSYQASLRDGQIPKKPTTTVELTEDQPQKEQPRQQEPPKAKSIRQQLSQQQNNTIQDDPDDIIEDEELKEEDKVEEMHMKANYCERSVRRISCKSRQLGQHFRNENAQKPQQQAIQTIKKKGTLVNVQIDQSKVLNQTDYGKNEDIHPSALRHSSFKITLWRVLPGEPFFLLSEQIIDVTQEVFILKNKLHFSQDGKYVYLVILGQDKRLWKSVVLDSQGLNHKPELDFDFTAQNINGRDITCNPQMMSLKVEFLNLIGKGHRLDETQMMNRAEGYIMCFQDSSNIILCSHQTKFISFP